MDYWLSRVEAALNHQVATGSMTPDEAVELPCRLNYLAFNMTVAGQRDQVTKSVATAWLFHLRTRKLSHLPQASQEEQLRASKWWVLGEAADLLSQSEDRVAFVERSLQIYFCISFCRSRPFDAFLLRLAARDSFREVWRRWSQQDQQLVERLVELLMHAPQARVRYRAARALSYLADPRSIGPLSAALNDASAGGVRIMAAQALGSIGDARAIEPLVDALKRDNDSVRSEIAKVLGSFGEPAVMPLIALLRYPIKGVARSAVKALTGAGDKRAIGPLVKLLINEDRGLVNMASYAIATINRRLDQQQQ